MTDTQTHDAMMVAINDCHANFLADWRLGLNRQKPTSLARQYCECALGRDLIRTDERRATELIAASAATQRAAEGCKHATGRGHHESIATILTAPPARQALVSSDMQSVTPLEGGERRGPTESQGHRELKWSQN